MKIGLAQINSTVGDLAGNARKIIDTCRSLERRGAEIILTPELVLTGYPRRIYFSNRTLFQQACGRWRKPTVPRAPQLG